MRGGATGDDATFTIRGIGKGGSDVFLGEFGKVGDDLGMRHSGGQPAENIRPRDTHAPDARPSAALARLLGDDVFIGGMHKDLWPVRSPGNSRRRGVRNCDAESSWPLNPP